MTTVRSPAQTLLKILALEAKNRYNDHSVGGGLDRYLQHVRADGVQRQLFTRIIAQLPQAGYASLAPRERQQWATWVESQLQPGAPRRPLQRGLSNARLASGSRSATDKPSASATATAADRPRPSRSARPRPPRQLNDADPLSSDLSVLGRMHPSWRNGFETLGIKTVYDLLWHIPLRYQDWRDVRPIADVFEDQVVTVVGEIVSIALKFLRGGRKMTEARVKDASGALLIHWWNQPYLSNTLKVGMRVGLSGRVVVKGRRVSMESPEWERLDDPDDDTVHVGRLSPIYPQTAGLPNRTIRRLAHAAVRDYLPLLADSLPSRIVSELSFPTEAEALRMLHFPDQPDEVEEARRRIAFQELFAIQLAVLQRKAEARRRGDAPSIEMSGDFLDQFTAALPFELTVDQQKALTEIRADMLQREPMARLLQGDVGSGKTVVAAAAMLAAVRAGQQTVLMAPTEVLASQHFDTFQRIFGGPESSLAEPLWHNYTLSTALDRPLRMALLVGSMRASRKRQIQQEMANGMLDLVVGTHALIQDGAQFQHLGLAVVDEQHRFGVMQRDALRSKGRSPHLLVMTATPIPRTLALSVYGDLDLSIIRQLPPGRRPVATQIVDPSQREEVVYSRIRAEVEQGRQAFIICPLVDESESLQAESAIQRYAEICEGPLRDLAPRIRLLHGRMSGDDKREVMRDLADGAAAIVVATIVVEVGVDLPQATVMAIEGAERFGLSQLHQLRGRVGRSDLDSICFLISDTELERSSERLELMVSTNNGFDLAEADLEIRGPGQFYGTRQSGLSELRVARLTDHETLRNARNWAYRVLEDDPHLRDPEHRMMRIRSEQLNVEGATAQH